MINLLSDVNLNEDRTHQISIVDFDTLPNLFGENFFYTSYFQKVKL